MDAQTETTPIEIDSDNEVVNVDLAESNEESVIPASIKPHSKNFHDKSNGLIAIIADVYLSTIEHISLISQSYNAPLAIVAIFGMFLAFLLFIAVFLILFYS